MPAESSSELWAITLPTGCQTVLLLMLESLVYCQVPRPLLAMIAKPRSVLAVSLLTSLAERLGLLPLSRSRTRIAVQAASSVVLAKLALPLRLGASFTAATAISTSLAVDRSPKSSIALIVRAAVSVPLRLAAGIHSAERSASMVSLLPLSQLAPAILRLPLLPSTAVTLKPVTLPLLSAAALAASRSL